MTPLRAKLMNPKNAVPDTGINLKNGRPELRVVRPYQPTSVPRPEPPPKPKAYDGPGVDDYIKLPSHDVRDIIMATCNAWGTYPTQLLSKKRVASLVRIRHAAIAVAYRLTPLSGSQLMFHFRLSDHTSIFHAVKKMAPHITALSMELDENAKIGVWVRALKARLKA